MENCGPFQRFALKINLKVFFLEAIFFKSGRFIAFAFQLEIKSLGPDFAKFYYK